MNEEQGKERFDTPNDRNQPLQKAREVADEMEKEVDHYVQSAKDYWDEFADEAKQKGYIAKEGLQKLRRHTDEYVHKNPWHMIGVAAGMGALVALLFGGHRERCRHE